MIVIDGRGKAGMLRIYLSYAHPDEGSARQLAEALEDEGAGRWTVLGGRWNQIRTGATWPEPWRWEIAAADVVVVLLSSRSVTSRYVLDEAQVALDGDRHVVAILIDGALLEVPFPLQRHQPFDLTGWNGERTDETLDGVIEHLHQREEPPQ